MSLVAWYPLTGTLEDFSGNGKHAENVNALVDENGKIGKCYTLDGSNYIKTNAGETLSSERLTISFWVKVNTIEDAKIILGTANGSNQRIYIGVYSNKWCMGFGNQAWHSTGGTGNVEVQNKWCHVVYATNGKKANLYVDGVLADTKTISHTFALPTSIYIGNNRDVYYNAKASYNDLRIYDEVLSVKEIKEISKAKILHYKFNEHRESTVNLLPSHSSYSGSATDMHIWDKSLHADALKVDGWGTGCNDGVQSPTIGYHAHWVLDAETNKPIMKFPNLNNSNGLSLGYRWLGITTRISSEKFTPLKKYTISWEQKVDVLTQAIWIGLYHRLTTSDSTSTGFNGCISPSAKSSKINVWEKKSYTFTLGEAFDFSYKPTLYVYGFDSGGQGTSYVRNVQLEEKESATPYVEGTRVDYITDASGFRNHTLDMGVESSPQWIEDGVIGSGCCKLTDTTNITTPLKLTNYNLGSQDGQMTISCWLKLNEHLPANISGILVGQAYYGGFGIGIIGTGTTSKVGVYFRNKINHYSTTNVNIETGKFYHCVAQFDNVLGKIYFYLNGNLIYTRTIAYGEHPYPGRNIAINTVQEPSGLGPFGCITNGQIDDVRVYATALSADDILELYQSRGSVTKNGKLMVNEIIEAPTYNDSCKGVNLVRNGYGELGNNTNMGGTFVSNDGASGFSGCFEYAGYNTVLSSDYIKINKDDTYRLKAYIKSLTEDNRFYFGVACYDAQKSFIYYPEVNHYPNSRTTLAKPLNNGDTVVYLTSSNGWTVGTQGVESGAKTLALYNLPEATNYERNKVRSRYLNIDTTAHTITLKEAWTKGSFPAGTKVSNAYDGGTYNYIGGQGAVPMEWTEKTATITGWGVNDENKFRWGTEYIRILLHANFTKDSSYKMRFGGISFVNESNMQQPDWCLKDSSVNKQSQLQCKEIVENNYKPSLIDYSTWQVGSTIPSGWANSGTTDENCRVVHPNPRGNLDIMWATLCNDAVSDADGGFVSPNVTIDKTKKYRFSVWIRRENCGTGSGTTYFGCYCNDYIYTLSGTASSNPYFCSFGYSSFSACTQDKWALLVAYVHPHDYASTTSDSTNGLYSASGTRIGGISDCKWGSEATQARIRAYLYYSTKTDERQYFYRPRIDLCDGSEPTIQELLSCNEHVPLVNVSGVCKPKDTFSLTKNGSVFSKEFIES